MTALRERFDALVFDLDGVIYVGAEAVPHAAEAIAAARAVGIACAYVTNNASRPPLEVAAHLRDLGIEAAREDVITSPQAAVSLLPSYVEVGASVLVIGGQGIVDALVDGGYAPVRTLGERPAAVMQGFSPDVSWRDLAEATFAVRSGLPWIATNPDLTVPMPGGIAPGNGALVRLVAETVGRGPDAVAGKPEPPLLRAAVARLAAERPLMVGDRLDTDIAAGSRVGIPTLLVMTGVTTVAELLAAVPAERPDFVGADLRVLGEAYPEVELDLEPGTSAARCRQAHARVRGGVLQVHAGPGDAWDVLRAAAAVTWAVRDQGSSPELGPALAALEQLLA